MAVRDPQSWMWHRACDLLEEAEHMHRQFFRLVTGSIAGPAWQPPVDIYQRGPDLMVYVALPGVSPDHIQVEIDQHTLVVSGERPMPQECGQASVCRLEIPHGRFERRVKLPNEQFRIARHEMADGCLALLLSPASRS
jgi:HSP20 family molecular chaperone IbpA